MHIMNMKRFATYILTTSLLTTSAIISPEALAMPESLEKRTTETLGNELRDFSSEDGVITHNKNGDPIFIVIGNGIGGEYNFINLNTQKNLKHGIVVPGTTRMVRTLSTTTTADGTAYFVDSNANLYKADPNTLEFTKLPRPNFQTGGMFFDITTGDDGWLYIGDYAETGGKLIGYNTNTGQWKDYGIVLNNAKYAKSVAYYNGKVYVGTGTGKNLVHIIEIDVKTGDKKQLPDQNLFTFNEAPERTNYVVAHDGYLYISYVPNSKTGGTFVYDIANKKYTDMIPIEKIGSKVVAYKDSTVVFNGKDGKLYSYNPKTKQYNLIHDEYANGAILDTSVVDDNTIAVFDGIKGVITLRHLDKTPLKTIQNSQDNTVLYAGIKPINSIGKGPDNSIIIAPSTMSRILWKINDRKSKDDILSAIDLISQRPGSTRTIDNVGNKLIYSQYANSVIVRADDIQKGKYSSLGMSIGDITAVRPIDSEVLDDTHIAIANTPSYGTFTGALTLYNAKDHKIEKTYTYPNLTPYSVAYDGKDHLYVGTSILGEHSPKEKNPVKTASILKINIKTHEIVAKETFGNGIDTIGAIGFDKKGRLYAYANDTLAEINKNDLTIIKKQTYSDNKDNFYSDDILTHEKYDGMFAVMNGTIYWINPDDITKREEIEKGSELTFSDAGNLYYSKDNKVHRAIPYAQSSPTTSTQTNNPTTSPTSDNPQITTTSKPLPTTITTHTSENGKPSSSTTDVQSSETNSTTEKSSPSITGQTSPTTSTEQTQTPDTTSTTPTDGSETTMSTRHSEPSVNVSEDNTDTPKTTTTNPKETAPFPRDDDHKTFESTARDHEDSSSRSRANNEENNGSKVITNAKPITQPTTNNQNPTNHSRFNTPSVIPIPAVSANTPSTHNKIGPTVATGGSIEKSLIHKIKMFLSQ